MFKIDIVEINKYQMENYLRSEMLFFFPNFV